MLFAWGAWLASRHPLWPVPMLGAFLLWMGACLRFPGLWLTALPAALPLASLAPWTGWLMVDEFDILVAASLAAGYARTAAAMPPSSVGGRWPLVVTALIATSALVSVTRGVADAGGLAVGLFQGYSDAANSLRLFKPVVYGALLWPLLAQCFRDRESSALAMRRFALGMWLGMGTVAVATILERLAFAGLLDFRSPYRTVALFWEMHVGGAAIDAYVALAVPFVAWAVWSARSAVRWSVAAAMALAAEYACLTTFSRGVYLAVLMPLACLMVWLLYRQRHAIESCPAGRGRQAANLALLAAMVLLASEVLRGDAFMMSRIAHVEGDYRNRLVHWRHGLDLLDGRTDWWLGIGLGRLPSRYAAAAAGGEFSGRTELVEGASGNTLRLSGPATLARLGGFYALTQRLPPDDGMPLTARVDARSSRPTRLIVKVCQSHLLYERHCQSAVLPIEAAAVVAEPPNPSTELKIDLPGPPPSRHHWDIVPSRVYSISVPDAGATVDVRRLSLTSASGVELIRNGAFEHDLSGWFPSAKTHFLPWHIDNLYLELLIERGLSGLTITIVMVGAAARRLMRGRARHSTIAPFLLASMAGVMLLGCISSVMDVPRVAFGFVLVVLVSLALKSE